MSKGFKIICLECGKETTLTQGKNKINNDNMIIEVGNNSWCEEISIVCDCLNEIEG